ncbi:hypothetical protein FB451DRAFT_1289155 [Mycena latifolia]|nr:hypothetical protein FB451DRAFT_1289155 [Mycena latifolia]
MLSLAKLRALLTRPQELHRPVLPSPLSLPLEVWELVLEELGDEGLVVAARVCRAFNDLCIAICLTRNEISAKSFDGGILNIHSRILYVLQLSRLTPQIHTLVCHFWIFRVLRNMKFLRHFVVRSHEIKELQLSFAGNLINTHKIDTSFPYSQQALLTEFCNVLRAMAAKTRGPVVVVIASHIYRLRSRDLANWGLRYFKYWSHPFGYVAWIDRIRYALKPEVTEPNLLMLVSPTHRGRRKFRCTEKLQSVNVRAIPAASDRTESFTFMTFTTDTETFLEFGTPWWSSSPGVVPGSQLTSIIPHITMTSLRNLRINEDVDPKALGEFLARHHSIRHIDYGATESPGARWPNVKRSDGSVSCRLLTSFPLALPCLTSLSCRDPAQIIPLLDSFDLSPQLSSIKIGLERQSPDSVSALKRAFRRLSLRTAPLSFTISAWRASEHPWEPISEEERQITGCVYCIHDVYIYARDTADAQLFIPWLGMLPALSRLVLSIYALWRDDGAARPALLQEFRAALPWVPEIEIHG